MKSLLKTLSIIAILAIVFNSCKKDDDGGSEPFSQKSVEENKQLVENSAIEVAKSMDKMKDLESTDAAVSLGNLFDMADPMSNKVKKKSKVSATIGVIAGISSGDNDLNDVFKVMKSSGELAEEPETIQEFWDEIIGTYTWNPIMLDWDYQSNSDKVVFKFPSTEGGQSNDATLTVSNYTGVIISNPLDEEYSGDLPTSLNMDLVVGSTTLITYVFSAEYNSDGVPSIVASDLSMETFNFSVDFTNTSTEISASAMLKDGDATVMAVSGSAKGDFSEENIDKNTNTHSETYTYTDYQYNPSTGQYEPVQVTETDEWEEVDAEEIIHSASASFQVFDIALKGDVNIKALVDKMDALYPDDYYNDPNFDEKGATDQEAAAINEYVNLRAVNVSTNEKIAQVEAYVVEDTYWGELDYWVDMRLKFGDGSYVDMETYFEEGFEDFIDEINTMITELNGEYDWDLEQIDY